MSDPEEVTLVRVNPIQFIAALGNPESSSGSGASQWGIWRDDPGPRGVQLEDFEMVLAMGGYTPSGWTMDLNDWWMEENGVIMEKPEFPLPNGHYLVTGGRETQAVLSIDGDNWKLSHGAKLHDVTHLPCRSARYHPVEVNASPANANPTEFPVTPGAEMPAVNGCKKQDYWVLFILAMESKS